ncbi:hypothetical protein Y032_0100g3247 [Ancylostoma ceylanicum]|uniref:Gustatory receptor n=1 Tax=Ancylostoma ceylanicum TaxID=53326 RepID=A0A016TID5_9BILA|nr:hypothetical protein Y032_0100g3247 [Ancylostoma ceylanicum]
MDFAAYDNSEAISKKLESLFSDIGRPLCYTSRCLFIYGPFQAPKSSWQKFQRTVQIGWTILLSLFVVGVAAISVCKMPPVYYCVYLIGCIDFFFLLYWNKSERVSEYSKRLKKSSIGVGTLKNAKQVLLKRNVSLAIGGLCSMMVFGILAADMVGVVHLLPKKSISLPWCCLYLTSLFLVLLCVPAANSTAFCYIESATAEFEIIDRDFGHDGNKHQLPVARHYIRGHGQLLKLFAAVRGPLSAWCSAHISLNFIAIYKIFHFLYGYDFGTLHVFKFWKPALLSFLLVLTLVQSICIFYSAIMLRKWIVGIRDAMMKVATSERIPHEQVFPLFSLHSLDLHHQPYGLSFFGLTVINRHFVIACVLIAGLGALYCYQQYN